jgi:hypothetical protein
VFNVFLVYAFAIGCPSATILGVLQKIMLCLDGTMNWIKNVVLVFGSVLFAFAIGEVATRALVYFEIMDQPGSKILATGSEQLESDKYNAKQRQSSNPILASEYDPGDPNVNSLGLRGKETTIEKSEDVYRIALIGDSFAYGFSVALSDIFATRVERRLNENSHNKRYEVLNFGRAGYGTVQQTELYRTYVNQFEPDEVLLCYVLNDVTGIKYLAEIFKADVLFKRTIMKLSQTSQFVTWIYIAYQRVLQNYVMKGIWEQMYEETSEGFLNVKRAMAEISDMAGQDGVKIRAVIFPVLGADSENYPYAVVHKVIKEAFLENKIVTRDLLPIYQQYPDWSQLTVSQEDQHPNAKGHDIATTAIVDFLTN